VGFPAQWLCGAWNRLSWFNRSSNSDRAELRVAVVKRRPLETRAVVVLGWRVVLAVEAMTTLEFYRKAREQATLLDY
jgi:hypothetical protein